MSKTTDAVIDKMNETPNEEYIEEYETACAKLSDTLDRIITRQSLINKKLAEQAIDLGNTINKIKSYEQQRKR